jgi:hypothetical protein
MVGSVNNTLMDAYHIRQLTVLSLQSRWRSVNNTLDLHFALDCSA